MGNPNDPQKGDERVEELLTQLEDIFNKLTNKPGGSGSDGGATNAWNTPSIEPASTPPVQTPQPPFNFPPSTPPPAPAPAAQPPISGLPVFPTEASPLIESNNPYAEASPPPSAAASMPLTPMPSTTPSPPPVAATGLSAVAASTTGTPGTEPPMIELTPEEAATSLRVGIYYPMGRENDAKVFCSRVEAMTPKFTRVTFQLRTVVFWTYDSKVNWVQSAISIIQKHQLRAFFVIHDRVFDEARKKELTAAMESMKVYYQDVPVVSIDKKPLYTDLLLGMIFFFDTGKDGK